MISFSFVFIGIIEVDKSEQ